LLFDSRKADVAVADIAEQMRGELPLRVITRRLLPQADAFQRQLSDTRGFLRGDLAAQPDEVLPTTVLVALVDAAHIAVTNFLGTAFVQRRTQGCDRLRRLLDLMGCR